MDNDIKSKEEVYQVQPTAISDNRCDGDDPKSEHEYFPTMNKNPFNIVKVTITRAKS